MALILVTVPAAWALLLLAYRWSTGLTPVAQDEGLVEGEEEEAQVTAVAVTAAAAEGQQGKEGSDSVTLRQAGSSE